MGIKRNEIEEKYKWNLESIYSSEEELNKDFEEVKSLLNEIKKYKGILSDSWENLYNTLYLYEKILRISENIYVYTHMKQHEDTRNNKNQALSGKAEMLSTEISTITSFIVPEIIEIDENDMNKYMESEKLKQYKKFIDEILRKKPYTLSPKEEELLALSSDIANTAENTFEMLSFADVKFPEIEDEEGNKVRVTHGNFSKFLQSKNRTVRKNAFKSVYETYEKYKNTFASTLSGSVKREIFYSKARKYNSAIEASLFEDNINLKVYENLINVISKNLDDMYKYLKIKKGFLKVDELHMYDLYTPLVSKIDIKIKYEDAKDIILKALKPLGDEYLSIVKKAFDERWIDVYENEGKKGGAYSWGSYDSHPFILLNYKDDLNSLFTLVHELGHSLHSYYSRKNQPYLYSHYKIFVAEVASTLNEQLLMEYMLNNAKTKEEKLYILNYYLEQFRTTVYRQTMFAEFEKIIHEKSESGEALTSEDYCNIYYDLNLKYYGENTCVDKEISFEWARVPHFYSNFYVYKYATGFSAASILSHKILSEGKEAVDKYLDFLKSGGSDYPLNQLKKAGVDMEDEGTIQIALDIFKNLVKELENEM
ncbi:oligoendopeptidase F [Tepidibacter formicigenes]|jgi:oligoendopeptidase F|uniref:Oligopeptidase F n=1 Tax=Tepidibacter formicigenes DSM 15518 TaxID=1123349 RepID=A0A1M6LBE5_9FIRM|nr:oligoendopeptidase F [Tepidibacter formicigenes]SHJ68531.1 oligoendopeptidase F [Tepidibacter formicigenes DSM 15518]